MSWLTIFLAYFIIGLVIATVYLYLDNHVITSFTDSLIELFITTLIWPLPALLIPRLIIDRIKIAKQKIMPLKDRLMLIEGYLDELATEQEINPRQVELIDRAYGWFYVEKRHSTHPLDTKPDFYDYNLCTLNFLDYLVNESKINIIDFNRQHRKERSRPPIPGLPLPLFNFDSSISISPHFQETFDFIRPALKNLCVSELKTLARSTKSEKQTRDGLLQQIKMNGPLPCIILTKGVVLVIEPESVGFCLMGIICIQA